MLMKKKKRMTWWLKDATMAMNGGMTFETTLTIVYTV